MMVMMEIKKVSTKNQMMILTLTRIKNSAKKDSVGMRWKKEPKKKTGKD